MASKKWVFSVVLILVLVGLSSINVVGAMEMWSQTYSGSAYSLVKPSGGGFVLAGTKSDDFWLAKTDDNGVMEWNMTYGGSDIDWGYSMIQTNDGGYALAGYTKSFGAGNGDFWLVKTDKYGNMEWNKTYGGPTSDCAYSLIETSDGGYALAGRTYSFGAGDYDFWLVKTDESGTVMWNKTYGGTGYDEAQSVVETSDGGFAIAGCTHSFGAGYQDFFLVKTDMYGNLLWNRTYGEESTDWAYSLIVTSDGGFALAGSTGVPFVSNFWLIKTDSDGEMLWNTKDGTFGGAQVYSLVQTFDGGYALVGPHFNSAGGPNFYLVKTNSNGNIEWSQLYGGEDAEMANSLVQTSDGGFAIAGFILPSERAWLLKTDQYGIVPEFSSFSVLLVMIIAVMLISVKYKLRLSKYN